MADCRMPGTERGPEIRIEVDGDPVVAFEGETVATAMHASGRTAIRRSARLGTPRGIFCNMGICYECLVYVDGDALRACMLQVRDGMKIETWGPEA